MNVTYALSKSTFVRGLQCEKSLYLHKNHPELRDQISKNQEAIFAQGTSVGALAQQLFPGGMDCSLDDFSEIDACIQSTRRFIAQGEPIIYEAAFRYNNVLVFADLLVQDEDGWKMYEVKSSTGVKDVYIQDAALQNYVLNGCGVHLVDVSIVHINNQYDRNGPIEVDQLFSIQSIRGEVAELISEIPTKLSGLRDMLQQNEVPDVSIGPHCGSPYPCDFMGHCWNHIPEKSVFEVAGLRGSRKFELLENGVVRLVDIPDDYPLSKRQRMQVAGVKSKESSIDKESIKEFLNKLNYPLYYLDFETINPAIPLYDRSRPYQQIPFQYSLHVQETPGGACRHTEYLAESDGTDPRIQFIRQLIKECGNSGSVVVYNKTFEKSMLKGLASIFPAYADVLNSIVDRMVDLMIPFQKGWYYLPEMNGSYSIKFVLPALVPELSYKDLEVSDGGTASNLFKAMAEGIFIGDFEATRKALLDYCKMDTWAMVRILDKLNRKVI